MILVLWACIVAALLCALAARRQRKAGNLGQTLVWLGVAGVFWILGIVAAVKAIWGDG